QQRLALVRLDRRLLTDLLRRLGEGLEALTRLLTSLSYEQVLARGFALVRDAAGHPLASAASVAPGAHLSIEFADGRIGAIAEGEAPPHSAKPGAKRGGGPKDQGSLL